MTEPMRFYSRPEETEAPPPKKRGRWLLRLLLLVLICWVLTLAVAPLMLRTEMRNAERDMARSFQDIETAVRIPLPFVLSFRVRGYSEKSGVQVKHVKTHYFLWLFNYSKEIPDRNAPFIFKWMWF